MNDTKLIPFAPALLAAALLAAAQVAWSQTKPAETAPVATDTETETEKDSDTENRNESDASGETPADLTAEKTLEEYVAEEEADAESDAIGSTASSSDMALTPPKSMELDMSALGKMDPEKELADEGEIDRAESKVETKDWTERAMDLLELHGYFRVRPELYHKFYIRNDDAVYNLPSELADDDQSTKNNTLAGANLRFRLAPTLNISEDIRIKSEIDFLDNVMMGATPRYLQTYNASSESELMDVGRVQGWNMGPPDSGQMVNVRRVWGEVKTPFGHLRFGRMGDDWGLGMLHNSGNGINDDFGDSVDRLLFAAKINDWLIMPAFDFPNEGMSSSDAAGRPFDVSQLDDSYRLVGIFGYIHDKEDQAAMLKRGDWLINAGLYFSYQWQVMSFENELQYTGTYNPLYENDEVVDATNGASAYEFYKREMWNITPDLWFQVLYGTFHLELEAALIFGEVGNPDRETTEDLNPLTLVQWGMVLQIDYGLLADALRIGAEFGYAQGDKDITGTRAPSTFDQDRNTDDTNFTAFSFNPAYSMDLILHRHILGSVAQDMYFKGWVQYDFLKNPMGRNLSIRGDVIYTRAIFEESTISQSSPNLGVELDAKVMYRSQDGFYAGISYGVLFPLSGFKGDPDEDGDLYSSDTDLSIPQTVQAFLGISF